MPMATAARPHSIALNYALAAIAWGLGLFALLAVPWIETHAVLPATRLQGRLAAALIGATVLPVDVTLACSGTDVLAMCVGAVLAYPVKRRTRIAGAAVGVLAILALNIVRIATLSRVAASPALFTTLHLYVWPAALALATAAYVFTWMRVADRMPAVSRGTTRVGPTRRFVLLTGALVVIFAALSPLYLESANVLAIAALIAQSAAGILQFIGVPAVATGNLVVTARGGFAVTGECVSTPLIPVYLAAVLAYVPSWQRRVPALIAAVPIFIALGIVRLLLVALPPALVASPLFFVHAFYQLLMGVVVVCAAAYWRHPPASAWRRAATGVAAGALALAIAAPVVSRLLAGGPAFEDPQGATALLPAFQIALLVALWAAVFAPSRWRTLVVAVALMAVSQAALFAALHGLGAFGALAAHVPEVRAWALGLPLAVTAVMRMYEPPRD